jgi:AcrR family transcriptional regulator
MPEAIDRDARLDDIAKATLDVATEQGVDSVTIRAIAARMGGSTTVITRFVPSRAALIDNVIRYIQARWRDELQDEVDTKTGTDRIRALIRWSTRPTDPDRLIRRFWLQALTNDDDRAQQVARDDARREHARIRAAVTDAGNDQWVADVLYLALRGYYVSSIEDPGRWSHGRAAASLERLIETEARA